MDQLKSAVTDQNEPNLILFPLNASDITSDSVLRGVATSFLKSRPEETLWQPARSLKNIHSQPSRIMLSMPFRSAVSNISRSLEP